MPGSPKDNQNCLANLVSSAAEARDRRLDFYVDVIFYNIFNVSPTGLEPKTPTLCVHSLKYHTMKPLRSIPMRV